MTRLLPLVLAAVALAAAGCGSSSSSSSSGSSKPGTEVHMQNIAFSPKTLTVKLGKTVKWTNDDTAAHNVVADSGASFRSKDFRMGGTYSYTPTKAGTIKYECTLHPGMDAELVVVK
jgi:plastocyanin